MSIFKAGSGQYLTHCAEQRCKSPVALGLEVEIARGVSELRPRIPDETWGTALFTPCSDHIQPTKSYLDDLGFTRITEIPLTKLQEWAGSGKVETKRSAQSRPETGMSMSAESLRRLNEYRRRR